MGNLRIGSAQYLVRILLDSGSQLIRKGTIRQSTGTMQDFNITTVGGETLSRTLCVIDRKSRWNVYKDSSSYRN